MATKPSIQPGEWISIGKQGLVKGVVCTVFRDTIQGDCEVVYLDMGNRAINEDVRWAGSYWEFVHGRGGVADTQTNSTGYSPSSTFCAEALRRRFSESGPELANVADPGVKTMLPASLSYCREEAVRGLLKKYREKPKGK
jgi:hypothetical protein